MSYNGNSVGCACELRLLVGRFGWLRAARIVPVERGQALQELAEELCFKIFVSFEDGERCV
jgi:hypothetical protein